MKKIVLFMMCVNSCFAAERIPPQVPVLLVMAANVVGPVEHNEKKPKLSSKPRPKLVQKNEKRPKHNNQNNRIMQQPR